VHVTGCIHRWRGRTTQGAMGLEYTKNEALAGRNGERDFDVTAYCTFCK
jgi:hypothetical protein